MKNNNNTKLILLHPYIQKQGGPNRLWLLAFVSFLTLAFLATLIYSRDSILSPSLPPVSSPSYNSPADHHPDHLPLPASVVNTLIHYVIRSNYTYHMLQPDIEIVADALGKCPAPCNFLVFGLTHETLLWKALNHNGRTVFVDENRYYAAYFEEQHPEVDAYDVQYTTKASEMKELIASVKEQSRNECRPVQNLLFSECKLGINDLPNHVYDVDWDVILVDGPSGEWPDAPGRMSSIFTAGVLARSKKGGSPRTHVIVHDYYRDVERVCGDEFLCRENRVASTNMMGHFVLKRADPNTFEFCSKHNRTASTDASPATTTSTSS
ncbi:hypothetical protein MLD38_007698 [Melastoma candidum]|uniref:Uncharacterized protein n=1 Tax=Melastoma candidum TaxID=119954 RepID=A0ACB9RTT5_9MYRT|nr:hypothetical protein MLD38_007698 [Melastoma candidum]